MSKNENGQSRIFYKILQILMKIPVLQNIRMLFFFYDSVVAKFIKKPEKDSSKKRVLVVFPFALGDCILFLGAIENMQKIYQMRQDIEMEIQHIIETIIVPSKEKLIMDLCTSIVKYDI